MFKAFYNFYNKPVIGVAGPTHGGSVTWWFIKANIWWVGGAPKRITPTQPCSMDVLDGLVLSGGADVGEWEEGEAGEVVREIYHHRSGWMRRIFFACVHGLRLLARYKVPQRQTKDRERDKLEMKLLRGVFERGVPVLGICRGAQLLNVYCGGTLHRTLKSFYQEIPQIRTVLPRKEILLDPTSQLANILETERCRVNALHWQAIDKPGKQIRVVAREKSSVIQAIEHEGHPFAIGVQWHPEYLLPHRRQRKLFLALVEAARMRK